jgi:hypothetical protein
MNDLAGWLALSALIPAAVSALILAIRESGRGHTTQQGVSQ